MKNLSGLNATFRVWLMSKIIPNNNYLDDMYSAWFYIDILQNLIHSLKYNDHTNFSND